MNVTGLDIEGNGNSRRSGDGRTQSQHAGTQRQGYNQRQRNTSEGDSQPVCSMKSATKDDRADKVGQAGW